MTELPNRALQERYRRLVVAAEKVVDDAKAIGDGDACSVSSYRLAVLRRELDGELQPTSLATMGS